MHTATTGRVIIAGAGPGDPELITVKLQRRLKVADVIITDRLVNPLIIRDHARLDALVITAGKQANNRASVPQEEISAMMVSYAQKGSTVLRLKGGDVAFFSNVFDELRTLVEHHISYEIIPGITAASGISASTGIPLTARNYAQGVQFLSFTPSTYYSAEKWRTLANDNDTLVFYMAAGNIAGLAEVLLRYSRKPATPIAVVEQGTTVHQCVHRSTLQACATDFAGVRFSSPALVIIGEVVNLHTAFNWFHTKGVGTVFNELAT